LLIVGNPFSMEEIRAMEVAMLQETEMMKKSVQDVSG
jgi:hypothetical protein